MLMGATADPGSTESRSHTGQIKLFAKTREPTISKAWRAFPEIHMCGIKMALFSTRCDAMVLAIGDAELRNDATEGGDM
jgi:hypothetical protein